MKKKMLKSGAILLSMALIITIFAGCAAKSQNKSDNSLVIGTDADYNTLHPSDWSTTIEQRTNSQIYDTLLAKDNDDQSKLVPRVAKKWTTSKDGKCYTFYLRKGVKFHDGTELTAKDVAFTYKMYSNSEYQGAVVDGLDHTKIVNDYEIKVYTKSVYAPFLASMSQMFIGSKAYYDKVGAKTFAQKPVGCGAYKWISHDDGNKWTLKSFKDYYGGSPSIKEVTFKVISDVATMSVALQNGEVDFADLNDPSIYSQLKKKKKVDIEKVDQSMFGFVAMNTEKYPYNKVKFRQAINYAMNREDIVKSVREGLADVNSNLLTKDRLGYSDKEKQYTYDKEKAQELLKECGIKDGYDLGKMYVAEQYKSLAQVVQSNLKDVGLKCDIEILEFNTYLKKLSQGAYGITCLQMSLEGDTQQVSMALCSQYIGQANNARYSNPQIDKLFRQASATINEKDREKIYIKIFTKVQDEAVYAVLYNPVELYAHNKDLKVPTFPLDGVYFLKDFSWK